MKARLPFPVIIVTLILLAYANGLSNGFVWLDQSEILNNDLIISDFSSFLQILLFDDNNYQGYHRPMYNLMHSIDYWIWNDNAFGYHLSSLILHIVNALFIYFISLNFGARRLMALGIALTFALLPCHTATVSLIHSKADLLSFFFMLLPVFLFSKSDYSSTNSPPLSKMALWGILFLFALLSKEIAIMLPFFIIALVYLLRQNKPAIPKSLVASLTVISGLFLFYRLGVTNSISNPDALVFSDRILSFVPVYVDYMLRTLSGYELTTNDAIIIWNKMHTVTYALYILAFVLLLYVQYYFSRKHTVIATGFLWFNLFMIPVAQIIPILHFRADRFMYLPSIGFIVAMAYILFYYYERIRWEKKETTAILLFVVLVIMSSLRIWDRNKDFVSNQVMFNQVIADHPECREAQGIIGNEYYKSRNLDKSLLHIEKALKKQSKYYSYVDKRANQGNLGILYMQQNKLSEAHSIFTQLKSVKNYNPVVLFNLGICNKRLKNYPESKANLEEYLLYKPNNIDALFNLGQIGLELGDNNMAKDYFNRYLKYNPSSEFRTKIENFLKGGR